MLGKPKHVGKESNKLEAWMNDELDGERDFQNVYEQPTCACGRGERVTG